MRHLKLPDPLGMLICLTSDISGPNRRWSVLIAKELAREAHLGPNRERKYNIIAGGQNETGGTRSQRKKDITGDVVSIYRRNALQLQG